VATPNASQHDGTPLNVLVVDDHGLFRDTARRVLAAAGFTVVGEASDGADAIQAVNTLRPDLVVLDIQLPDMDGFQVARELSRSASAPAVVLVSSRDQCDYGGLVERSTAQGFIAKAELTGKRLREVLADGEPG
jgi:DNA-binding NarL/FixJ family response regulator